MTHSNKFLDDSFSSSPFSSFSSSGTHDDDVLDDFADWIDNFDTLDELWDTSLPFFDEGRQKWHTLSSIPDSSLSDPMLVVESEEGNIEYKLKLDPNEHRFQRLVTQLNCRLMRGCGQALYMIGVSDKGKLSGVPRATLDQSILVVSRMAKHLDAIASVVTEMYFDGQIWHRVTPSSSQSISDSASLGLSHPFRKPNKQQRILASRTSKHSHADHSDSVLWVAEVKVDRPRTPPAEEEEVADDFDLTIFDSLAFFSSRSVQIPT